jgi:hypothetical protein
MEDQFFHLDGKADSGLAKFSESTNAVTSTERVVGLCCKLAYHLNLYNNKISRCVFVQTIYVTRVQPFMAGNHGVILGWFVGRSWENNYKWYT